MYRTSKNENNCFFLRCLSRGDYATRLMSHTKMVAKSARVQKLRNCTEAKRLIEKQKKTKSKSAKKEKRKKERNSWMRDWAMEEKNNGTKNMLIIELITKSNSNTSEKIHFFLKLENDRISPSRDTTVSSSFLNVAVVALLKAGQVRPYRCNRPGVLPLTGHLLLCYTHLHPTGRGAQGTPGRSGGLACLLAGWLAGWRVWLKLTDCVFKTGWF